MSNRHKYAKQTRHIKVFQRRRRWVGTCSRLETQERAKYNLLAVMTHKFAPLFSYSLKRTIRSKQILGPSGTWLRTSFPKLALLT